MHKNLNRSLTHWFQTAYKISCHSLDILLVRFLFAKIPKSENGWNSTMMDLTEKKKKIYTGQLIFHKQCIYEISKPKHTWFQRYDQSEKLYIHMGEWTYRWTDRQAQNNNCPPNFFEVGGKKKKKKKKSHLSYGYWKTIYQWWMTFQDIWVVSVWHLGKLLPMHTHNICFPGEILEIIIWSLLLPKVIFS